MRIAIFATALLFPVASILGTEPAPSIYQHFGTTQDIEQSIASGDEMFTAISKPSNVPLALQQTALNTLNLVDFDNDIGSVEQRFSGQQNITNTIVAGAVGALTSISQDGTNLANVVEAGTIESAFQIMGPGASQLVSNKLGIGGNLSDISQEGLNVANMATAEHAIGVGVQEFHDDSSQWVRNHLSLGANSSIAGRIVQSGTNVGNMLIAKRVDEVVRRFDGEQVIENTVILNDGYRPRISQSGNNIANFISAKEVGTIHQISTGSQVVENRVRKSGPDGPEIRHANFEQTESNYMGASNVVNLMIIEPSRSGGSNDDVVITQEAEFHQSASGSSGQSQSGNVLVINR